MEQYNKRERRRHIRIPIELSLHLVVFSSETSQSLTSADLVKLRNGIIRDLSLSGASIQTDEINEDWLTPMCSGLIQIALKFSLPNAADAINATAQVIWIKKSSPPRKYAYLLGVQFVDMKDEDRKKIVEYILQTRSH